MRSYFIFMTWLLVLVAWGKTQAAFSESARARQALFVAGCHDNDAGAAWADDTADETSTDDFDAATGRLPREPNGAQVQTAEWQPPAALSCGGEKKWIGAISGEFVAAAQWRTSRAPQSALHAATRSPQVDQVQLQI